MARQTGDLYPNASGSASLGVEQLSQDSFSNDIRPYATVHMNSGVFHDPLNGQSGIMRFVRWPNSDRTFEFSSNGGLDYHLRFGSIDEGSALAGSKIVSDGPLNMQASGFFFTSFPGNSTGDAFVFVARRGEAANNANFIVDTKDDVNITAESSVTINGFEGINLNAISDGNIVANAQGETGGQIWLRSFGASGQLRYQFGPYEAWHVSPSHTSDYFPIAHSGQVNQMILESTVGVVDLDFAYDNGNVISPPLNGMAYQGATINEPTLATGDFIDHLDPIVGHTSFGLAVSGSTPNAGILRCGSTWLHILSSGATNGTFLGYNNLGDSQTLLSASGAMLIEALGGDLDLFSNNDVDIRGDERVRIRSTGVAGTFELETTTSADIAAGTTCTINADTDVNISAGSSLTGVASVNIDLSAGTLLSDSGGQITLSSFSTSGQLEYRFGPHQSWYMKTSDSSTSGPFGDGFNPLVPSGQVQQMILENSVQSIADREGNITDATALTMVGCSGVEVSVDEITDTITVSGVECVAHFFQRGTGTVFTTGFVVLDYDNTVRLDAGYSYSAGVLTVPFTGWYKISATTNIQVNNDNGNTRCTSQTFMTYNGPVGGGGASIFPSVTYGHHYDSTVGRQTGSNCFYYYLFGGDNIRLQSRRLAGGALDLEHTLGSTLLVEFKGNK